MKNKILLLLLPGLLFLGCSQKVVDPIQDSTLSLVIVDCDKADEFFQNADSAFTKPATCYVCACPDQTSEIVPIAFNLPRPMRIKVEIKNITGYILKTYDMMFEVGLNVIEWDRKSDKGKRVKSGIYIIAFRSAEGLNADSFIVVE